MRGAIVEYFSKAIKEVIKKVIKELIKELIKLMTHLAGAGGP